MFVIVDLPPNIHSIFISSATQQALQICVDEDVTQDNNWKLVDKEVLLKDIETLGQGSNFYEFQQQIQVTSFLYYSISSFAYLTYRTIQIMKSLWSIIMITSIHKISV